MNNLQYRLTPMQEVQSIPIHWKFSQDDYRKLAKGRQSNWSVFLRDGVVHFCRATGEEFYRFVISKSDDGIYATDNLEAYIPDDFYKSARLHGWAEEKIERHRAELRVSAIEETTGLLASYFNIKCGLEDD